MASQAEILQRTVDALDRLDSRHRADDYADTRRRDFERALSTAHEPRRLDFAMMARPTQGLASQFFTESARQVPPEFWQLDGDDAIIACPCEHDPHVPQQQLLTCECGRMFVFDGDQVRVLPASFFAEGEPAA